MFPALAGLNLLPLYLHWAPMALRLLLVLGMLLMISLAKVSSDLKLEEEEKELRLLDETLIVFVRGGNRRLMQNIDCSGLCKLRCSSHSRPSLCYRACGTCCVRCKCVPPGTSGNRELCGTCYMDMTTHGNKTKCP
ncbi:gibberellin-regulated protein 5-like isoform X1 [Cicer arietinum]